MKLFWILNFLILIHLFGNELPKEADLFHLVETKAVYRADSVSILRNVTPGGGEAQSRSLSMEFEVNVMEHNTVRIRVDRVVTGDAQGLGPYGNRPPSNPEAAENLKGLTFLLIRRDGHWVPHEIRREHIPVDGGDLVVGMIIEKFLPLIFPSLPDQFESREGFAWRTSVDGAPVSDQGFRSDAKIQAFTLVNRFENRRSQPMAVIRGEQRHVRNAQDGSGESYRFFHSELNLKTLMSQSAFERYEHTRVMKNHPLHVGERLEFDMSSVFLLSKEDVKDENP